MLNGKLNIAICISGGGTTMQQVLRAHKDGRLPHVNPVRIISSNPNAKGIEKARAEGILDKNIRIIVPKEFDTAEAFGEKIFEECYTNDVGLIFQCGFIPIMPSNIIEAYRMNIVNQHPGPLDQARLGFGGKGMHGLAVHCAVLHFARKVGRPFRTEATVHRVTNEVDGGAILGTRPVKIMRRDYPRRLAARVLPHEHNLVIETILQFSEFGGPQEIHREHPLIRAGEETLLEEAKNVGRKTYPKG